MNTIDKTKWLTKNYENLKGFLIVPIGCFFLFLAGWNYFQSANSSSGKDIGIPLIMIVLTILITLLIERYYSRALGKVKIHSNLHNILIFIIILVIYFLIDYLDMTLNNQLSQPISITGLAWASLFLYLTFARKQFLYLIFSFALALLSFLPAMGLISHRTIFNDQYGVWGFLLIGLGFIVGGLVDHFTLIKLLPSTAGLQNE